MAVTWHITIHENKFSVKDTGIGIKEEKNPQNPKTTRSLIVLTPGTTSNVSFVITGLLEGSPMGRTTTLYNKGPTTAR